MNKITLGPIIGMVDHKKAKIWYYGTFAEEGSTKPYCHVFNKDKTSAVTGSPFEFKAVLDPPYEKDGELRKAYVAEIKFPAEGEEFSFGINYDPGNIGTGELKYMVKRFPAGGDMDFSFGLISCHKPRKKKLKRIDKMWGFLHDKMLDKKSSFLIQAGDQVYCDNSDTYSINAWEKSVELIENSPGISAKQHKQMLDFYREVYFSGWEFPAVQKVMSTFPQYMIWDDHEIEDGWGSKKEDFEPIGQGVFRAAREAYIEFQHSHNPEPLKKGELYYAFHYGAAAFLVPDLRGERNITKETLIGSSQWNKIENWLKTDKVKNSKILFVVTSVPVVHLSRKLLWLSKLVTFFFEAVKDDVADQWTYKHNRLDRQRLLKLLSDWSGPTNKPVFILGGDVHVGTEVCMKKRKSETRIYQVTSSPITNNTATLLDFFTAPLTGRFHFKLDEEDKEHMCAKVVRRHRKRNFAIIEVKYDSGKPAVTLNMFRQGEKEPKTRDLICYCKKIKYKGDK
jgi:alkaline phosphatase D